MATVALMVPVVMYTTLLIVKSEESCPQNEELLSCIRGRLKPQQCDQICSCNCEGKCFEN